MLSSEPVKIPWFDYVLADIGDEQSLSQSLSTFSGHLKQISVGFIYFLQLKLSAFTTYSLPLSKIYISIIFFFYILQKIQSCSTNMSLVLLDEVCAGSSFTFSRLCFCQ